MALIKTHSCIDQSAIVVVEDGGILVCIGSFHIEGGRERINCGLSNTLLIFLKYDTTISSSFRQKHAVSNHTALPDPIKATSHLRLTICTHLQQRFGEGSVKLESLLCGYSCTIAWLSMRESNHSCAPWYLGLAIRPAWSLFAWASRSNKLTGTKFESISFDCLMM